MRPLDGVRVLDLSRVLSGPSCGKALADLGAEVIKVEPPEGDLTRRARPRRGGVAVYFSQQNCGKRCISLDLRTDEGKRIALELATRSDVVLENFRPGVTDRLGLGYDDVRARNPGVIYCSITGYGQTGAARNRRAYAPIMHAELGLIEFTARKHRTEPRPEAVSHADLYAGMQATIGILAALRVRDQTGEGQHVDVSMAETMLVSTEWTAVELAGGPDGFHVFGGYNAPVLRLGDGTDVCVTGDPVANFPAWCQVMDREELLDDERFATPEARDGNHEAMAEVLGEFASGFESLDDFQEAIGQVGLVAGAVRSMPEALDSDWAREREALVDVGDDASGEVLLPRSPLRFSGADAGTRGTPAYQGEDNRDVLGDLLGLSDQEIDGLEEDGVLRSFRVD